MKLGDLIHEKRIELGMTLEELGSYCSVGKSIVSKWEKGQISKISEKNVSILSEVLGIPTSKFVFSPDILSDDEQAIVNIMRMADVEKRKSIIQYAKYIVSQE